MNTLNHEKLVATLESGRVYRRNMLASLSTNLDRDLALLVKKEKLEKVAPGLYYKPAHCRYGVLPPSDEELVRNFLRNDPFLLYSWNSYNALGLGLTQLYVYQMVYNRKRHGLFTLGGRVFDFRRPARGFPEKLSKEFLVVDLINNLSELMEETDLVKDRIKAKLSNFNQVELKNFARLYGKISTAKFFEEIVH